MTHLTYLEAAVVGVVQGVTEMFPISSLGHAVLIPAVIGGRWAHDLNIGTPGSPGNGSGGVPPLPPTRLPTGSGRTPFW